MILNYLLTPDDEVFVVEVNQQFVACVVLVIIKHLHHTTHLTQLIILVVDKLLQYVENYSHTNGCVKIQLTSGMHHRESGAHRFYLKHCYKADATQYFFKKL